MSHIVSHIQVIQPKLFSRFTVTLSIAEQRQQLCFGSGLTRRLMPLLTTPTEVGTIQYLSSMYAVLIANSLYNHWYFS